MFCISWILHKPGSPCHLICQPWRAEPNSGKKTLKCKSWSTSYIQTFEKLTDGSDRCNDSDNCSKSSALYLPLVDHWKLSPQHARQSWSKQFRVELFLCVEICTEMLIWWVMPMQTRILRICIHIVCIHDEMHKHLGLPLMCISEVSRESCLLCSHKSKWRTDGA
jgi:hypothetical protein